MAGRYLQISPKTVDRLATRKDHNYISSFPFCINHKGGKALL